MGQPWIRKRFVGRRGGTGAFVAYKSLGGSLADVELSPIGVNTLSAAVTTALFNGSLADIMLSPVGVDPVTGAVAANNIPGSLVAMGFSPVGVDAISGTVAVNVINGYLRAAGLSPVGVDPITGAVTVSNIPGSLASVSFSPVGVDPITGAVTVGTANTLYTATKYVDPAQTGTGHAGSAIDPWTLVEAFANAIPGDRVMFLPGTITLQGATTDDPWAHPNNYPAAGLTGTGNDIVYFAQYPAAHNLSNSSLWTNLILDNGYGAALGMNNYTVFSGFNIGQRTGWLGSAGEAYTLKVETYQGASILHDVRVEFCRFEATLANQVAGGGNWGLLMIEYAYNVRIYDNYFYNLSRNSFDLNTNCIELYDSYNYEIDHNTFVDCQAVFFVKGVHSAVPYNLVPGSIHHNYIQNCELPFEFIGVGDKNGGAETDQLLIYQNLIDGVSGGMYWGVIDDMGVGYHPQNVRMNNNTFVNVANNTGAWPAFFYGAGLQNLSDFSTDWTFYGCEFENNIVYCSNAIGRMYDDFASETLTQFSAKFTFAKNTWYSMHDYWKGNTWAAWSAANDSGSHERNPLFTSYSATFGAGDYSLSGSSLELNAGTDVLNLLGTGTSANINRGCDIGDGSEFGIKSTLVAA